jgi:hypothetical protein
MKIRHTHTSSRFNRSPNSLEVALDKYMADSDLLTITEVDSSSRVQQIAEKGWKFVHGDSGPRDECAVAWRKDKFALIYGKSHKLTSKTYKNDRGWQTAPPYGTFAVLETEGGKRILVGVTHFPWGNLRSLISRHPKGDVAIAFNAQYAGFRLEAEKLAERFDVDGVILVADWNIDIKSPVVRAWFKLTARGYKVNWSAPFPARGTFGSRVIDIALLSGTLRVKGRPRVLPHDASSDHTPFAQELELV